MKKCLPIILLLLIIAACLLIGLRPEYYRPENEIRLQVQLCLKEDIGLLAVDYTVGEGISGSGGVANADKSLLKHDELFWFSIEGRPDSPAPEGALSTAIRFKAVTEYVPPNYDNVYPEELTQQLDELCFEAEFGRTYSITLSGDRAAGYTAVFNGEISGTGSR